MKFLYKYTSIFSAEKNFIVVDKFVISQAITY